jgi:3',5'-cyclic AMP phosphodiesterase CpdA
MRLAVISDVHGDLRALEAVLADIKGRGVDITVNLGDCVTGPLWPKETFEVLQSLALPTVRGNHDRWIEELADAQLSHAGKFARAALQAERGGRYTACQRKSTSEMACWQSMVLPMTTAPACWRRRLRMDASLQRVAMS